MLLDNHFQVYLIFVQVHQNQSKMNLLFFIIKKTIKKSDTLEHRVISPISE
jgi:hypothetical protein